MRGGYFELQNVPADVRSQITKLFSALDTDATGNVQYSDMNRALKYTPFRIELGEVDAVQPALGLVALGQVAHPPLARRQARATKPPAER